MGGGTGPRLFGPSHTHPPNLKDGSCLGDLGCKILTALSGVWEYAPCGGAGRSDLGAFHSVCVWLRVIGRQVAFAQSGALAGLRCPCAVSALPLGRSSALLWALCEDLPRGSDEMFWRFSCSCPS